MLHTSWYMANYSEIQKLTRELFDKMGFAAEVKIEPPSENTLKVKVKIEEPRIAIGQSGQQLLDLQYLLRLMTRKHLEPGLFLDLDINDYKQKKAVYLKQLALEMANEAALSKKEKELPPMPSYERRLIHMTLQDHPNVVTESIGQGADRRIIIKPKP